MVPIVPQLAPSLRLERVAESCRKTALRFVDGATSWDKRELVDWLTGPYRRLTLLHYSLAELAWAGVLDTPEPGPTATRVVHAERVHRLMDAAREQVLRQLELFSTSDDGASFVLQARGSGAVIRCEDARGRRGFLPIDQPGSGLAKRVFSLLAVDYLLRPDDYELSCTVCSRCASISFDPEARRLGLCAEHRQGIRPTAESGVSVKDAARAVMSPIKRIA